MPDKKKRHGTVLGHVKDNGTTFYRVNEEMLINNARQTTATCMLFPNIANRMRVYVCVGSSV